MYQNLSEVLRQQAVLLGSRPALRYKKHGLYHDLSWQEYWAEAEACAAGLVDTGCAAGDRVGLLAENRVEWLLADMGILSAGCVNVPPHAPLTAKQIAYQLADAGVRWLFVSTTAQLDKIRQVHAELPALEGVVLFDSPLRPSPWPLAPVSRVECWCWQAFQARGRPWRHVSNVPENWAWPAFQERAWQTRGRLDAELRRRQAETKPDDLATIMYTSGTTGNPKGVMLTHGNLLSNAQAMQAISPHQPGDLLLNWLPLSHIYARTVDHYRTLVEGATIALAESAETVIDNLEEVQPTHMSAVPRFYEKVLASIAESDPAERGRRLRDIFGPRVDWLMSGGAPLSPAVARAYHEAGILLLQGYGLTETAPVISFNRKDRFKIESVGLPLPGVEVRIAADGEVLTRGPHVMPGYWNNPAATAEALSDGWFYTGDLGRLDADGFLFITGRKKELLVLSNGKKVVPNFIEGLLQADPCIEQAVVHGERKNFLTALIVPSWENVRRELRAAGIGEDKLTDDDLAKLPAVRSLLKKRIDLALADVSNWEQVKKFVVLPRPFTVAADELTVSLKLRRNVVLAKHAAELEKLYGE